MTQTQSPKAKPDLDKALAQLAPFELAGEGDYLLKVVQAAHRLGCDRLNFKITRRGVVVELEFRYTEGVGSRAVALGLTGAEPWVSEAGRHLGIALVAGLGVGANEVVWSLAPGHYLKLGINYGKCRSKSTVGQVAAQLSFMKEDWFGSFFRQASCDEHHAVYNRANFSRFPIAVDSRAVGRGWSQPFKLLNSYQDSRPWYEGHSLGYSLMEGYLKPSQDLPAFFFPTVDLRYRVPVEEHVFRSSNFQVEDHFLQAPQKSIRRSRPLFHFIDGAVEPDVNKLVDLQCGAALTLHLHLSGPCRVYFILDGVYSEAKEVNFGIPGLTCVVSGEGLQTDSTEYQVVEDDVYGKRLEALRGQVDRFLTAVKKHSGAFLGLRAKPKKVGAQRTHPSEELQTPNPDFNALVKERLDGLFS